VYKYVDTALHRRKLGKMWEGPSHSIWGTTPRTSAKGRVGVSMERQCIGLGVILCQDSLDWRMKIVGHEKVVSANFCCLYFTTVRPESSSLDVTTLQFRIYVHVLAVVENGFF